MLPGAPDAHHTPVSGDHVCHVPGVTVPDMYGRPWAQLWEKYFEQGMQKPKEDDIFDFSK